MKLILGGVLGGIILFMWSSFSWMVLPWHKQTLHHFTNEAAVVNVLKANAPTSGIYLFPFHEATTAGQKPAQAPQIFTAIHQEGVTSMNQSLLIEFITQCIAAFFVTWLLMKTSGLRFFQRVIFVTVFALTVGVITHFMYWNWFKFPLEYTLVLVADLLIGWTLAGIALAAVVGSRHR